MISKYLLILLVIKRLSNQSIIKGKGIFPNVSSVKYDWKEKRVGTKNPYTLTLTNTGTAKCTISFSKFISSKDGF